MDIDEQLREAGARWRSEHSFSPEADLARMTKRQPGQWRGRIGAVASALAVFVVVVGFLVFRANQTSNGGIPASSKSPGPTAAQPGPLASLLVQDGDRVRAVGVVVASPGVPIELCQPDPQPTVSDSTSEAEPPTCSAIAVTLAGFNTTGVKSWTTRRGVGFTAGPVAIQGVWQAGAINVIDVADATPADESPPIPSLPCSAPPTGWVVDDFASAGERELALARLQTVLGGSPDIYAGVWSASPQLALNQPHVVVVGTVRSPQDVDASLRAAYPGNLCIEQVDHSSAQLTQLAQRLEAAGLKARVSIRPDLDRVELRIAMIDDQAAASVGADSAAVVVEPMVRPY